MLFIHLQIDQKVTETVKGSNRYKCGAHVDTLLRHIDVPVASNRPTLEEREEETSHSVQHYEDAEGVAEDLVCAAREEPKISQTKGDLGQRTRCWEKKVCSIAHLGCVSLASCRYVKSASDVRHMYLPIWRVPFWLEIPYV